MAKAFYIPYYLLHSEFGIAGGIAPLLTMLNSCAAGIGVVNIDNGFGAAILAGQILRTAEKLK